MFTNTILVKGILATDTARLGTLSEQVTAEAKGSAGRRIVVPGLTTTQNEAVNGLHALLTDVRKAVRQERAGDSGLQRTFLVGKRLGPSLREYLLHAGLIRDAVTTNLGWLTTAGVTEATVSAIGAKILLVAAADAAQSGKLGLTRAATTNRNALTKELRTLVQRIQLAAERAFAEPEKAGILAEFSGASSPAV